MHRSDLRRDLWSSQRWHVKVRVFVATVGGFTAAASVLHCGGGLTNASGGDVEGNALDASIGRSDAEPEASYVVLPDGALVLSGCPQNAEIQVDTFSIPTGTCGNWPPPPDCDGCTPPVTCDFSVRFTCPSGGPSKWEDWLCDCGVSHWHCIRTDQGNASDCPVDAG